MNTISILKEFIDQVIQMKIFNEFKAIGEISDALNITKIIINYAMTTSSSGDESLNKFIARIYSESTLKSAQSNLKFNVSEFDQLNFLDDDFYFI